MPGNLIVSNAGLTEKNNGLNFSFDNLLAVIPDETVPK